jgi:hypothetical protein
MSNPQFSCVTLGRTKLRRSGFMEYYVPRVSLYGSTKNPSSPANAGSLQSKAIRGARYFVAPMSTNSSPKRGFVQKEIRKALEVLEEFPDNETYLIPVRLDNCEPPHPRLADLQWTDLFPTWEEGIDKLLRFLGQPPSEYGLPSTLKLNGLYESKKFRLGGRGYSSHLRFYPDGLVLSVSSTGNPREVARWFSRDNDEADLRGHYSVSGITVRFSVNTPRGAVDHEGEIHGDTLVLRSHSLINDNRDIREYSYVPSYAQ